MTAAAHATLYARIFVDRIVWFMADADLRLVGHGVVPTYVELRGVQLRGGIPLVLLDAHGKGFHLPEAMTYGGQWRIAEGLEIEALENFFAQANRAFSEGTAVTQRKV